MKYYIVSDTHGFYSILKDALFSSGFFDDPDPHRLVILGDLFDRGDEAAKMQDFVLSLMGEDQIILIRGNHEDLFVQLVTTDKGLPYHHHLSNGTYETALQLTGFDYFSAHDCPLGLAAKGTQTPYYQRIIPAMVDYYETKHYIFTHGWIPCIQERDGAYSFYSTWRDASPKDWMKARWINGMDAARTAPDSEKTIVCGHWHTSYGHSLFEKRGSEFGPDADFSPYYGPGIIAVDACTAYSKKVNVLIINDEDILVDASEQD